ncbi:rod shape-determining protein MreD [Empedobacter falsenii]|uniref:rod shape-determining protein MreD n=1 Tax=Empedobacter falsenii TaxID=343874 RepID=UPI002574E27C|nr:rod shape-determining protein MreD [Empedobacter falsenii]MDM1546585.1 rod shape-determining protein MreD [Empedobacter falsenii]
MFNKDFLINIIKIIVLALLQVFVFNHINFLGSYQPYIYIVFVLFYPPYQNKYALLILSFMLGLMIDIFEYTGGIHAFALTLIAFLRNPIIKLLAGKQDYEMEFFSFNSFSFAQWLFYLIILIVAHHIILLLLENFKPSGIGPLMLKALINSGITFVFVFIYKILFKNKVGV